MVMPKWSGQNYIGAQFNDYYIVCSHHRDSGILQESNFRVIKAYLEKHNIVFKCVSFSHWVVGWIEEILVQEDNKESVEYGNYCVVQLEQYPIFDDNDFSNLESDKINELTEQIRNDINNLDSDESLSGWPNIDKTMTNEQIRDIIYDSGMIEL
jgi:hypothetical protein